MSPWDWTPYLQGGGTRPDAMTGLTPELNSALVEMFSGAPEDIRGNLRVNSAYRSNNKQAELWEQALSKYGSPEAARKWVAPPGSSKHNHGQAVDLAYLNDAAKEWAHANAAGFGLNFPMSHEPWHIEPVGARGGGQPALSFGPDVPKIPTGPAAMFSMPPGGLDFGSVLAERMQTPSSRPAPRDDDQEQRKIALANLIRY